MEVNLLKENNFFFGNLCMRIIRLFFFYTKFLAENFYDLEYIYYSSVKIYFILYLIENYVWFTLFHTSFSLE